MTAPVGRRYVAALFYWAFATLFLLLLGALI